MYRYVTENHQRNMSHDLVHAYADEVDLLATAQNVTRPHVQYMYLYIISRASTLVIYDALMHSL